MNIMTLQDIPVFQIEVFWLVTPCSVVVGYRRFGSPYCLHLQGEIGGIGHNGINIGPDWRGEAGVARK
jgi:hypothetical protein